MKWLETTGAKEGSTSKPTVCSRKGFRTKMNKILLTDTLWSGPIGLINN